jgi:hypothetical protein
VTVQAGRRGHGVAERLACRVRRERKGWLAAQIEGAEGGKAVKRYSGGDPDGQLIPIAPQTHSAVCPTDTMVRLRREVCGSRQADARRPVDPGQETDGVVEMGEAIKKQLAGSAG